MLQLISKEKKSVNILMPKLESFSPEWSMVYDLQLKFTQGMARLRSIHRLRDDLLREETNIHNEMGSINTTMNLLLYGNAEEDRGGAA